MEHQVIPIEARPRARQVVTADVLSLRLAMVNVYFVGTPEEGWVVVDAGLPGSAERIVRTACERFGPESVPKAIVLTHGHFDHVGALEKLLAQWDVPVYAHSFELPYLTGLSSYPPPDPAVGGGVLAFFSRLYRREGIDLGNRVHELPEDGTVPGMPGWRWIHTPGHTAGHISLFRDEDRTLIAGDAFVTTKQESLMAVLTQRKELHGPPAYFTSDWEAARRSVEALAELQPAVAATGHGLPMRGERLRVELQRLARDFDQVGRPSYGRYVRKPAIADERGLVSVPPPVPDPIVSILAGIGAVAAAGATFFLTSRRDGRWI